MNEANPLNSPTPEEIAAAATTLARLQPGFLPLPIFLQMTRLTVTSIVELVPLRKVDGKVQVLLTKRTEDDPTWPGMLHTPGTVVRTTDEEGSYISALHRILKDELSSVQTTGRPQYVGSVLHKVNRGMEDAKIFFVEIAGEPAQAEFYDMDNLPDNIITTQIDFIQLAAKSFIKLSLKSNTENN